MHDTLRIMRAGFFLQIMRELREPFCIFVTLRIKFLILENERVRCFRQIYNSTLAQKSQTITANLLTLDKLNIQVSIHKLKHAAMHKGSGAKQP